MEPYELLAAFNQFETSGLDLLAIFHSHPAGPSQPSPTDIAQFAYPGVAIIIIAPEKDGWQVRVFQIEANQSVEGNLVWQSEA